MSSEEEDSLALAAFAVTFHIKSAKKGSRSKLGRKWCREWLLKRKKLYSCKLTGRVESGTYTLRTKGALKNQKGFFSLSQIWNPF